jgi:hypothetical protein
MTTSSQRFNISDSAGLPQGIYADGTAGTLPLPRIASEAGILHISTLIVGRGRRQRFAVNRAAFAGKVRFRAGSVCGTVVAFAFLVVILSAARNLLSPALCVAQNIEVKAEMLSFVPKHNVRGEAGEKRETAGSSLRSE